MAVTTLDQAIAGVLAPQPLIKITGTMEAAGVLHSTFYNSGLPGAAAAPSPGMSGAALTSYGGQIPWSNPTGGNESRLFRWEAVLTQNGSAFLFDRLWHNSGIVSATTTAQTINSVAFPARDRNGATAGEGVVVALEVRVATTNAGAITNTTMSYTNSNGDPGKTATILSFPATAAVGTLVPFQLADGDTGVQSIQSITLGTSYGTGTLHLVAYRPVMCVGITANVASAVDFVTGGAVKIFDSAVLFVTILPSATTAATLCSQLVITQG